MTGKVSLGTRLYESIKAQVKSGNFCPGQPISAAMLSKQLSASTIPIREALQRLVGERLVEVRDLNGFFAPHISEVGLRDLYQMQLGLLRWILEQAPLSHQPSLTPTLTQGAAPASMAIERLFAELADRSGNRELQWSLHNTLDRLHAACLLKEAVATDWPYECERLLAPWQHGDLAGFKQALQTYHDRRIALVPALVERLNRSRTAY